MNAEEFLKNRGYSQTPHFPFDHIKSLMQGYAEHYCRQLIEGLLPSDEEMQEMAFAEKENQNMEEINAYYSGMLKLINHIKKQLSK